jgi:hypothetical protein
MEGILHNGGARQREVDCDAADERPRVVPEWLVRYTVGDRALKCGSWNGWRTEWPIDREVPEVARQRSFGGGGAGMR